MAIAAWVLIPLAALALGATGWQAEQSASAAVAQTMLVARVIRQTLALEARGRTVQLPSDFVADTSSDYLLVSCGENLDKVGCWVDKNTMATVTREITNAMAVAGLRGQATCAKDGTHCDVMADVPGGQLWFRVLWHQRDTALETTGAVASTDDETGQTDIRALVLPDDVFGPTLGATQIS